MIAPWSQGWRPYAVLALLCLGLYLPGMSALPVMDRDEARFAQATRQMIESGDYLRIRFQAEARNRKPAGIYWLQALSVSALSDAASVNPVNRASSGTTGPLISVPKATAAQNNSAQRQSARRSVWLRQ